MTLLNKLRSGFDRRQKTILMIATVSFISYMGLAIVAIHFWSGEVGKFDPEHIRSERYSVELNDDPLSRFELNALGQHQAISRSFLSYLRRKKLPVQSDGVLDSLRAANPKNSGFEQSILAAKNLGIVAVTGTDEEKINESISDAWPSDERPEELFELEIGVKRSMRALTGNLSMKQTRTRLIVFQKIGKRKLEKIKIAGKAREIQGPLYLMSSYNFLQYRRSFNVTKLVLLTMSVLFTVITTWLSFYFIRENTSPLDLIKSSMAQLAKGNFSFFVPHRETTTDPATAELINSTMQEVAYVVEEKVSEAKTSGSRNELESMHESMYGSISGSARQTDISVFPRVSRNLADDFYVVVHTAGGVIGAVVGSTEQDRNSLSAKLIIRSMFEAYNASTQDAEAILETIVFSVKRQDIADVHFWFFGIDYKSNLLFSYGAQSLEAVVFDAGGDTVTLPSTGPRFDSGIEANLHSVDFAPGSVLVVVGQNAMRRLRIDDTGLVRDTIIGHSVDNVRREGGTFESRVLLKEMILTFQADLKSRQLPEGDIGFASIVVNRLA